MGPTIAVVGNVNADLSYDVGRLPRPGETLLAETLRLGAGGKAANASVAIARLGATPRLLASLGTDALSSMVSDALESEGVSLEGVRRAQGPTGVATVLVAPAGAENAIVTHLGANLLLTAADIPELHGCQGLLLTLGVPFEALRAAVAAAGRAGIPVIVDATPLRLLPLPRELVAVDLLSVNRVEAETITGVPVDADPAVACALLHDLGAARVVIKLGPDGAMWSDGKRSGWAAAPTVEAVDPTGAGDAFMAGLTVSLLSGESLETATRFACTVGALAATGNGAQGGWSTLADVQTFLAEQPE